MNPLIKKALAHKPKNGKGKEITKDLEQLAIAWAKGEVGISQVEMALYGKGGGMSAYIDMARGLRSAVKNGALVEKKKHA